MPLRVLIAEDEELLLSNLVSAARNAGYNADGAADGATAMEMIRARHYDLLVTDIRMPNIDGMELIGNLREISPSTRFLAITGYASMEYAISCLRHGASDFLVKPFEQAEFLESVAHALIGLEDTPDKHSAECGGKEALSEREKVVLAWAKEGKSSWEIAQILDISQSTVKYHFTNIYIKLSVNNKAHAVAKAIELKLI